MEDSGLESDSTGSDIEAKQLGCIGIQRSPTNIIGAIREENRNEDTDSEVICFVLCIESCEGCPKDEGEKHSKVAVRN